MALSYLALGDSYTIGEGVAVADRWPNQLVAALRAEGIGIADPQVIASTGLTTDELSAAIDAAQLEPRFDLVSLLIGVNNQYRGRDLDDYAVDFSALLQSAIGFAGQRPQRVLVLSIPDWGVTRFGHDSGRDMAGIAAALDAYNARAAQLCAEACVAFVDITAISRACADGDDALVDDGLHPSAAQYRAWMQAALPTVRDMLAPSCSRVSAGHAP